VIDGEFRLEQFWDNRVVPYAIKKSDNRSHEHAARDTLVVGAYTDDADCGQGKGVKGRVATGDRE
jgi:hypothetical protein